MPSLLPAPTLIVPPGGEKRTALDSRLDTARRSASASPVISSSEPTASSRLRSRSAAGVAYSSHASRTTLARSRSASANAVPCRLALASRSSTSLVIRVVARSTMATALARSSSVASGAASTASTLALMMVSGLRSSWEASSMSCRCALNASSSRASMVSMVSARSFSSSRGPCSLMRRFRSVAWISSVVRVIDRTGRSTRPASTQPMPRLATYRPASVSSEKSRSVDIVRTLTAFSTSSTKTTSRLPRYWLPLYVLAYSVVIGRCSVVLDTA